MRESLTVWVQSHSESFHTPQFIFSIHGITSSKIIPLRFLILGCKYVTGNFLYFSFSPPIGYLIWAVMGFCNVFENWASKKKSGHTGRFFIERKGFENIHVATSLIVKIPLDTIWSCTSSIMLKWLQRGLWMILDCLFFLVSCCRLQWLT